MREVIKLAKDNAKKAEELLKRDPELSKLSITLRSASSLGVSEVDEFFYMLLDGDETLVKRACEILKENELSLEISEDEKRNVMRKFEESESQAMQGFGAIFS